MRKAWWSKELRLGLFARSVLDLIARLPRSFRSLVCGLGQCLFLLFSLAGVFSSPKLNADTITIAIPEFVARQNFLTSHDLASELVQEGTTRTLVKALEPRRSGTEGRSAGKLPYALDMSDSMTASADGREYSFRLRKGELFVSGKSVGAEDIIFSLNRCRSLGIFDRSARFEAHSREPLPGLQELWVKVDAGASASSGRTDVPLLLAQCPILEEASGAVFGPELGIGSSFVGTGLYSIRDIDGGRSLVMHQARARDVGAEEVVLRGFRDNKHALTALRTGTVDLFFTEDTAVLGIAANDQTLLIGECSGYKLIQRKGLQVRCPARLSIGELKYIL